MALRPNKPCRARGCNALTRNAGGYCDEHASQSSGWARRQDAAGSTTSRGYGYSWQKLREKVLRRDGYLCQCEECQALGRVRPAHEVDHRVPKAAGGTDALSNLRAMNHECHKRKTAADSRGMAS